MDVANMKSLIKKNIIDFPELVLSNYNKIGLDEADAIILIKLQHLLNRKITIISPKRISEMLSITSRETAKKLNNLIDKGFVQIELAEGTNGKQTEVFNLDFLIEKILMNDYDEQNKVSKKTNNAAEARLVNLFEGEFNKPLSVLDIQTITKWLGEENYTFEEISDALFEAVKLRKKSIKYVDAILINKDDQKPGQQKRTAVIKDLKKIWQE